MYRVTFMGPRRGRESLGHESRDDALRFLAKHAASVSSDVRIIAEDGSTERFPSSNEASFYESKMSFSTVVPAKVEQAVLTRSQASTIIRLLGMGTVDARATLRAMARRFELASVAEDEQTVFDRMRALAERELS